MQISLNDTEVDRLKFGPLKWYSHKGDKFAGLRIGVSKTAKTWYLSKRDPHSGKTRSIKLGRFPAMTRDMAWVEAQARATRIDNGTPETDNMPTFRQQLEAYIAFRSADRKSGRAPLKPKTAKEYRACVDNHFSEWTDKRLDKIPVSKAEKHMNELQADKPYAAQQLHVLVGAVFNFDHHLKLVTPRLKEQTKMQRRKLDRTVPWADRLAEIEEIDNIVIRTCWLVRWHTGSRENVLRGLTWDDVDLDEGTITYPRLKKDENPRTIAMSKTVKALFKQLENLHATWVFPSIRNDVHIDQLDRLTLTCPGDLRHLWHDAAMMVGTSPYMMRWLNGQNLKAGEVDMLGHYGEVDDLNAQRDAADKVSSYIETRSKELRKTVLADQAMSA